MAVTSWLGFSMVLIALLGATSVTALRCYSCNSNDNMECLSPPMRFTEADYRDNRTVPGRLLRECIPKDDQGRDPFCRTQHLLILGGGNTPNHKRVWRECGYERSRNPCYKFENGGHEEVVCQCFTDGCNGGARISTSALALLLSFGLLLRFLLR